MEHVHQLTRGSIARCCDSVPHRRMGVSRRRSWTGGRAGLMASTGKQGGSGQVRADASPGRSASHVQLEEGLRLKRSLEESGAGNLQRNAHLRLEGWKGR